MNQGSKLDGHALELKYSKAQNSANKPAEVKLPGDKDAAATAKLIVRYCAHKNHDDY